MSNDKKNYRLPEGYVETDGDWGVDYKTAVNVLRNWCSGCKKKEDGNCETVIDLVGLLSMEEIPGVAYEFMTRIKPKKGGRSILYCTKADSLSIAYFEERQRDLEREKRKLKAAIDEGFAEAEKELAKGREARLRKLGLKK
ncbi:MAG: hypothetical protein PHC66_05150 [Candidatus Nanoarchaeia archaeon]|nr:hypothetical protein [Candidatus Nanoarchaeia archaeon]MDD5239073.1 hypothetical protein [Candidatus Nanoarchaeia archaeon]